MLSVCYRVADNLRDNETRIDVAKRQEPYVLEEDLKNTTGLLVDETRNTLDTTTAGKTTDSGLGDTLNVVAKDLAVTLSTTLSETLERIGSQETTKSTQWG